MDSSAVKGLAEVLQIYGGWAMTVILMVAIVYLYRSMGILFEKRHEQFTQVLKETTEALTHTRIALERAERAISTCERAGR